MRAYLKAGGWWATDRVLTAIASALVQIALARKLGPEDFGILSHALALVALLLPLSRAGLSGQLVKNILDDPKTEIDLLRSALFWRVTGAFAAVLVGLLFLAETTQTRSPLGFFALIVLGAVGMALQVGESSVQARSAPRELVPTRLLITVLAAMAKILALTQPIDLGLLAWIFGLEFLLQGLAQILLYRRYRGMWLFPEWNSQWSRYFSTRAPWLVVSGLAEMVYLRIDILMLRELRGPVEAGIYSTAARLSEGWYAVPQIAMVAVFPLLWQMRDSAERWNRGVQATADALLWSAIAVAIAIQVFAEHLVIFVFGQDYSAAAPILAVHIWAGVFVFTRALISRWLIAEDLLKISLWSHGAGAITNVALNLWLIPPYGAKGAALATLISYGIAGWAAFLIPVNTRPVALQVARAITLPLRWREMRAYYKLLRPRGQSRQPH
ncbi:MAG: flippase [Gammaproteobacteria bacterium]|nr:flippase [Gammaproteobacteria bacterium]